MPSNIRIFGYIDKGYTGQSIMVECSIRNGFPGFDITGLPGASVKEARERVRCALRSCGFKFPQSRILVNLSPASQSKDSTLLDLPLACAILCSQTRGQNGGTSHPYPDQGGGTINIMIAGELSLDGTVLQSPQSIGAMQAAAACGCGICILPVRIPEAEQDGITVIEAYNLPQVFGICCDIMCGTIEIQNAAAGQESRSRTIFKDVIGLEREKEILTMAASGFHSTLLFAK